MFGYPVDRNSVVVGVLAGFFIGMLICGLLAWTLRKARAR